jgi:hypothetical protein
VKARINNKANNNLAKSVNWFDLSEPLMSGCQHLGIFLNDAEPVAINAGREVLPASTELDDSHEFYAGNSNATPVIFMKKACYR